MSTPSLKRTNQLEELRNCVGLCKQAMLDAILWEGHRAECVSCEADVECGEGSKLWRQTLDSAMASYAAIQRCVAKGFVK